jgi:hypothetical protein
VRNRAVFFYALLVGVFGIFLMGCATGQTGSLASASQSDLLKQAGFRVYTANSPQSLTYIQTLPVKKVVLNQYQDKPLYLVCTDPSSKQCFLGDKAAYDRYQQLATQVCLAEGQCQVSEHRWDPEALQMWADSQGAGG